MGTKNFILRETESFTRAELEAKVQEIRDDNTKDMVLLLAGFLPDEWDEMKKWFAAILGRTVGHAMNVIGLTIAAAKLAAIIEESLRADKLEAKMNEMGPGEKLYIYTDLYEWYSSSGNHFTYITDIDYDVK